VKELLSIDYSIWLNYRLMDYLSLTLVLSCLFLFDIHYILYCTLTRYVIELIYKRRYNNSRPTTEQHWNQKYWVGKPKYWWRQNVVKTDKCMGVYRLLGARARAALEVYTYAEQWQ